MRNGRMNPNTRCPADEDLARFVDRALPPAEREAMMEHLAGCAHCRAKSIEAKRLAAVGERPVPQALAEKAFADARRASGRAPRLTRFVLPAAVAAVICAALVITLRSSMEDFPGRSNAGRPESAGVSVAVGESAPPVRRIAPPPTENRAPEKNLLHAGWAYFQLSSTRAGDRKLIETLARDLAAANIRRDEGVNLVITQQYSEFLDKLSRLPKEEQKEFIDGYVLSMLYYSDRRGGLKRDCMEKSRELLADASGDEVHEAMLYSPECALPER